MGRSDVTSYWRVWRRPGFDRQVFNGVGLWMDLVRVLPSGTWERPRADLYQTASRWLGSIDHHPGAGLDHLIRSYLTGFGPAAVGDVASFVGTKRERSAGLWTG